MKIKPYDGDTYDLTVELEETVYELWRVHYILQRMLAKGFVDWHEIDVEDEKTAAELMANPNAIQRERIRVTVRKNGGLSMSIDANWWKSTDHNNHVFLLAGVGLQLLSEHPRRKPTDKQDPKHLLFNDASRYVVDEELFRYFDFTRTEIEPYIPGADFPPTMFSAVNNHQYRGRVLTEPFFNFLKEIVPEEQQPSPGEGNGEGASGDGEGEGEASGDIDADGLHKLVSETLANNMADAMDIAETPVGEESQGDKKDGKTPGGKEAGTGDSTLMKAYNEMKIIPKKRWEEILFAWAEEIMERDAKMSWRETPKHLNEILTFMDARLPAEIINETMIRNRERVIAFADTSGSCVHYFDRFARAVMSLPEDKFNLSCYCFDTRVYAVDRNNMKLVGGGGTDIDPCVAVVNKIIADEGYPPTVFCITDGYFSKPNGIQNPEKWIFFLTEGSTRNYLPPEAKVYELKDFE